MAMSKRYVYTLNNWTVDEKEQLLAVASQYHVVGEEVGSNGTSHLQGFVVFISNKRMSAVKKINSRAHWEIARGTCEQASAYCKKDGKFVEIGECPKTAGETEQQRWKRARDSAVAGKLEDIPEDIFVRYYRTLKEIKKDYMSKPDDADDVTGVWIYGAPGVGKSRGAREQYPGAYLKMQNKWWDGYQGEENVILDDFDSKELGHLLKIWLDRYSFLAETKGGAIHIRPKQIIITSNYSIDEIFGHDDVLCAAIQRRCKVVKMI